MVYLSYTKDTLIAQKGKTTINEAKISKYERKRREVLNIKRDPCEYEIKIL